MKCRYCFFKNSKLFRLFGAGLICTCVTLPSFAAVSNGCDKDSNNRIVPMLALCSTHVYNIGETQNSSNLSAKNQLMKDVIALKSTVMMQQMYKQYQYLEATVNRLKTQLEREILTSKLEVAGASSGSSGNKSSSLTGNNGVAGAEDCINAGLSEDVMECLSRNLNRISTAINNADIGSAKRQIEKDMNVLKMYDRLEKVNCGTTENAEKLSTPYCQAKQVCDKALENNNRQQMTECVNNLRVCITLNIEELQNKNYNINPYGR